MLIVMQVMADLFQTIVDENKLHRNYRIVRDEFYSYEAARKLLNEVYNSLQQIDPDFIVQFQGTGFDARIWELYLLATFQDLNFTIHRNHSRPDFELEKNGQILYVEAVTSNPSTEDELKEKTEILNELNDENWLQFIYQLRDRSMIRVAGAIYNKLRKSYWELEWVKNKPLILAVEPFHHSLAHWITDSNLIGYLYGFENSWEYDKEGNLQIETREVIEYRFGDKIIPSNFFKQPNSEYISAVVFSNSGTISKFSRMGKLKGYGDPKVRMLRAGNMYDHDPNAAVPIPFSYFVGEDGPIETWAQGLTMYHNPNAKYPIDRSLFPDVLHGYFDKYFYSYVPPFFPYQSETQILIPESYRNKKSAAS